MSNQVGPIVTGTTPQWTRLLGGAHSQNTWSTSDVSWDRPCVAQSALGWTTGEALAVSPARGPWVKRALIVTRLAAGSGVDGDVELALFSGVPRQDGLLGNGHRSAGSLFLSRCGRPTSAGCTCRWATGSSRVHHRPWRRRWTRRGQRRGEVELEVAGARQVAGLRLGRGGRTTATASNEVKASMRVGLVITGSSSTGPPSSGVPPAERNIGTNR